ncbi:MAG: Sua5 YciO YrdC YwlC family protein, partial [Campylobacteraceae bacterium]|nr:Sua5 YciO YrdC YwlC family protein [Campylobacteraceae bacterium]
MIYLAQTDTTVGFLSKDIKVLNALKKRPLDKPCI